MSLWKMTAKRQHFESVQDEVSWKSGYLSVILDALTRIALLRHESSTRIRNLALKGLTSDDIAWDIDNDVLQGERLREIWRVRKEDDLLEEMIRSIPHALPRIRGKFTAKMWIEAVNQQSPLLQVQLPSSSFTASVTHVGDPSPRDIETLPKGPSSGIMDQGNDRNEEIIEIRGLSSRQDNTSPKALHIDILNHDHLYASLVRAVLSSRAPNEPEVLVPSDSPGNQNGRVRYLYADTISREELCDKNKPSEFYRIVKPRLPLGVMQSSEGAATMSKEESRLHVTRSLVLAREQQFLRQLVNRRHVQQLASLTVSKEFPSKFRTTSQKVGRGDQYACIELVFSNVARGRKRFNASFASLVRSVELTETRRMEIENGLSMTRPRPSSSRLTPRDSQKDPLMTLRASLKRASERRSKVSGGIMRPQSSHGVEGEVGGPSKEMESELMMKSKLELIKESQEPILSRLPFLRQLIAVRVITRAWRSYRFRKDIQKSLDLLLQEKRKVKLMHEQFIKKQLEERQIAERLKKEKDEQQRLYKRRRLKEQRCAKVIMKAFHNYLKKTEMDKLWLLNCSKTAPNLTELKGHSLKIMSPHMVKIIKIQSWWRGILHRRRCHSFSIEIPRHLIEVFGLIPGKQVFNWNEAFFTSWFCLRKAYLFYLLPRLRLWKQNRSCWATSFPSVASAARTTCLGVAELRRVESELKKEETSLRVQFKSWESRVTREFVGQNAKLPQHWIIDHSGTVNKDRPGKTVYLNLTTGQTTTEHPNEKGLQEWKEKEWRDSAAILEQRKERLIQYANTVHSSIVRGKQSIGICLSENDFVYSNRQ